MTKKILLETSDVVFSNHMIFMIYYLYYIGQSDDLGIRV